MGDKKGLSWDELKKYSNLLGKDPYLAAEPEYLRNNEYFPSNKKGDRNGTGQLEMSWSKPTSESPYDAPKPEKKRIPLYNFREWEILSWCIARINDYKSDKGNRKKLKDYNAAKDKWKEVMDGKYTGEGPAEEFPDFPRRGSQTAPLKTAQLGKLEKSAITAMIGLAGGLVLLSPNVTGNAIANLANTTSNIFGIILFLIGIAGALFYLGKKGR